MCHVHLMNAFAENESEPKKNCTFDGRRKWRVTADYGIFHVYFESVRRTDRQLKCCSAQKQERKPEHTRQTRQCEQQQGLWLRTSTAAG